MVKFEICKKVFEFESDKDKQQFLEHIYDLGNSVEWDTLELVKLSRQLDINVNIMMKLAKLYLRKRFSLNNYKYQQACRDIDEKLYKFAYDYCEENLYLSEKVEELASMVGFHKQKIITFAQKYAVDFLGVDLDEYRQKKNNYYTKRLRERYAVTSKKKKIFEQLLQVNSLEEIISIIEDGKLSYSDLKTNLNDYLVVYGDFKDEQELIYKLELYRTNSQNEKNMIATQQIEQREKNPKSKELISDFVIGDSETISDFCRQREIDIKLFKKYVSNIKTQDTELYQKYINKLGKVNSKRYAILSDKIRKIVFFLQNGIEEYGMSRKFDLIDYYQITTKLPLDSLLDLAKDNVDSRSYALLERFVNRNKPYTKPNFNAKEEILCSSLYINYAKDSDGFPIPGTGELFSNSKKLMLMDFLTNSSIPLNWATYNMALERYQKGFLDLDDIKVKRKKIDSN